MCFVRFCEWSIVHSIAVLKGHPVCLKCGKTLWRPGLLPGPRWPGELTALPKPPSWWGWGWLPLPIHRRILVNRFGEARSEARRADVGGRKGRERRWGSCQKPHHSGLAKEFLSRTPSGLQPWPFGPRFLPPQIRLPKSAYVWGGAASPIPTS